MEKKKLLLLFLFTSLIILFSYSIEASNISLINNNTWQSNLTKIRYGSLSATDIDGDGYNDLILAGCLSDSGLNCNNGVVSNVYINNGSSFNQSGQWQNNITNLGWSSTSLGDVDNDGDLDLVLVGCTGATSASGCVGTVYSQAYINNGSSFNQSGQWQSNLTGIFDGAISLGDVDNDGDLDLALTGDTGNGNVAKIYINNGSTLTETSHWQSNLTGVRSGAVELGDVDNDGDLDLVLTGQISGVNTITKIYLNNGSSFNQSGQWQNNIISASESSVIFGDIDKDNDLDLVFIGLGDYLFIYKNNGSSFVEFQKNSGEGGDLGGGLYAGSVGFGDVDNDGDLDFAAMGRESTRNNIYEYNATNNNNFSSDSTANNNFSTDDLHDGPLVWTDVDNDTDLDLIAIGTNTNIGILARVYLSNASLQRNNTLPNPPTTNLFSNYSKGVLNLSWNNATDDETGSNGLYYNLMVGNETKNHTVVSGVYGGSSGGGNGGGPSAGYFGNMMQRRNISLNTTLGDGNYYWYVQTIDTALAKSNWSSAQNFTVDTANPTTSSITAGSITTTSAVITWTTNEIANSSVFYGDTIAVSSRANDGSYVTSHSITLSGLSSATTYYYNVSSCDGRNNCNVSTQRSFNSDSSGGSSSSSSSGGGGGGGGGGAGITTITPAPAARLFDVDFSKEESRSIEAKEGDIRTFSFNGITTHKITTLEIGKDFARLLIESEPISIILNIGKSEKIDINNDEIYDFEIRLVSILSGKAKFSLSKMEGAESVGRRELLSEALFDIVVKIPLIQLKVSPGDSINAEISLLKFEKEGREDVEIKYYVVDSKGNEIISLKDTRAVETTTNFVKEIILPKDISYGKYKIVVNILSRGEIVSSEAEFSVIEYRNLYVAGVIIISVIVLGAIFFLLWKMHREIARLRMDRKVRKSVKVKSGRTIKVH